MFKQIFQTILQYSAELSKDLEHNKSLLYEQEKSVKNDYIEKMVENQIDIQIKLKENEMIVNNTVLI